MVIFDYIYTMTNINMGTLMYNMYWLSIYRYIKQENDMIIGF